MTTRVDSISAASSTTYSTKPDTKKKLEEKKEEIISFKLPNDVDYSKKSERKERKADLEKQYQNLKAEYYDERSNEVLTDKLTKKEAEKFASRQVDNEKRYQEFLNTETFLTKAEYEKAKADQKAGKAYQGKDLTYIKDGDVRRWVQDNKHKFFKDGKFSSDLYKSEIAKWVGTDYKMNLDEKSAVSAGGDRMSKRDAKKAAKYAGIDVEKDLTWLYKTGALVGGVGLGAGVGAIAGGAVVGDANFNSYVVGKHQDGTWEIIGEQHSKSDAVSAGRKIGAISGALGALPASILAAAKLKDEGGKDVFQNSVAAEIVKDPDGIKNVTEKDGCRTIVRAILNLPNLTENQKIATLEYAYGKNTGKKVNKNELIAAYEAAKVINDLPPAPTTNTEPTTPTAATTPTQATVATTPTAATVPTQATVATTPTAATVPTQATVATTPTAATVPTQATTPTEPAPQPPKNAVITVENGESIARLAKKYGVSAKEIIELNKDQLKYFKSATDCDDNKKYLGFLVGAQIKLPAGANEEAIKKNQETNSEKENAKYRKASKTLDKKLCPERTKTYKPLDENFRKKNNIRTTEEAALEAQQSQEKTLTDEEFAQQYPYIARPIKKISSKTAIHQAQNTTKTIKEMSDEAKAKKEQNDDSILSKITSFGLIGAVKSLFD